uniref:CSD domain-containing protein n=1 Tax=Alexandrium monilatum TaxID=311494 RepID=A0A7S4T873_9DINO
MAQAIFAEAPLSPEGPQRMACRGRVRWFDEERVFGVIYAAPDIYVHISDVVDRQLQAGDYAAYERCVSTNGRPVLERRPAARASMARREAGARAVAAVFWTPLAPVASTVAAVKGGGDEFAHVALVPPVVRMGASTDELAHTADALTSNGDRVELSPRLLDELGAAEQP